jgi:hypothetical protein
MARWEFDINDIKKFEPPPPPTPPKRLPVGRRFGRFIGKLSVLLTICFVLGCMVSAFAMGCYFTINWFLNGS